MTSLGEESQSTNLNDSNKPVQQSIDRLLFAISSILFLKCLLINTDKATPCHLVLQSALLNHRLVLLTSQKYQLEFDNSGPGSPGLIHKYHL